MIYAFTFAVFIKSTTLRTQETSLVSRYGRQSWLFDFKFVVVSVMCLFLAVAWAGLQVCGL